MNSERIVRLLQGSHDPAKQYVLYYMQQSQRVSLNHALIHAVELANRQGKPLVVFFNLVPDYPFANRRIFTFMLEGLEEVAGELGKLGIGFVVRIGQPDNAIACLLGKASTLIMDVGYTRIQRKWRKDIYFLLVESYPDIELIAVESDVIVPVRSASDKCEYAAYTIRPKLKKKLPLFLDADCLPQIENRNHPFFASAFDLSSPEVIIERLGLSDAALPSKVYHGGYKEAKTRLSHFLSASLDDYLKSNDPSFDLTSKLSMYLHFGQISPLEIYLSARDSGRNQAAIESFLEQLFIRRELAVNYVYYNDGYDDFASITEPWAYRTMENHLHDPRPYSYALKDYLACKTHDDYFNACMKEMILTGYMQNYLRMYWAKKIIEWSLSYQEAFATIRYLNDTFFLDGRDPSSYASIAWGFGKHDRSWSERQIFGKLRYLNSQGLERKFRIRDYVMKIEALEALLAKP